MELCYPCDMAMVQRCIAKDEGVQGWRCVRMLCSFLLQWGLVLDKLERFLFAVHLCQIEHQVLTGTDAILQRMVANLDYWYTCLCLPYAAPRSTCQSSAGHHAKRLSLTAPFWQVQGSMSMPINFRERYNFRRTCIHKCKHLAGLQRSTSTLMHAHMLLLKTHKILHLHTLAHAKATRSTETQASWSHMHPHDMNMLLNHNTSR